MSYVRLAFIYLVHKPLFTFLTALFLIIPVTIVTSVLIFSHEAGIYFRNSTDGIDLILAARGSHNETVKNCLFFTGTELTPVSLKKTRLILRNPDIDFAVPLLISGSYHGHAVIGSNDNIRKIYHISLMEGNWWQHDHEAVIGSNTALKTGLHPGDTIYYSSRTGEYPDSVMEHSILIAGILARMHNSLDNVILTSIQNLWMMNNSSPDRPAGNAGDMKGHPAVNLPFDFPDRKDVSLTASLIRLKSPVRPAGFIQQDSLRMEFQAIDPAAELPGDFQSLKFTLSALAWSGISVFLVGLLALFVRLHYFTRERSEDLLLLRTMGAPAEKIMLIVILQGLLISDVAAFTGILFAHAVLGIMSTSPVMENLFGVSGTVVIWDEVLVYFVVIVSAGLVSLFPALKAAKNDILLNDTIVF